MPPSFTSRRSASIWEASDHSLVAESFDHWITSATTIAVAGTVYLQRVTLRRQALVTGVKLSVTVAAALPTANQNFVGVYDANGRLVALSAAGAVDAIMTGTGELTLPFSAPATLDSGIYWVALLFNVNPVGGAPPTIHRTGLTNAAMLNMAMTAANFRAATGGLAQTGLPANVVPSAAGSPQSYWVALY